MIERQKDWRAESELPVNGSFAHTGEQFVGLGEVSAAEEAPGGGKGRGVGGGEHIVLARVDEGALVDGEVTPKEEHESLAALGEPLDGAVGEGLPAVALVRAGTVGAHGQRGVQQQDALSRPFLEIAAAGHLEPHIIVQLLEDVLQRAGKRHPVLHRKTESVGLPHVVVGVLPDDHHLHLVKRRAVEGVEDARPRREHLILPLLFHKKSFQLGEIRGLELVPQDTFPGIFNLRVNHC